MHSNAAEFFLEPVDPTELPDYNFVVKQPTCFSSILEQLQRGVFRNSFVVWGLTEEPVNLPESKNAAASEAGVNGLVKNLDSGVAKTTGNILDHGNATAARALVQSQSLAPNGWLASGQQGNVGTPPTSIPIPSPLSLHCPPML